MCVKSKSINDDSYHFESLRYHAFLDFPYSSDRRGINFEYIVLAPFEVLKNFKEKCQKRKISNVCSIFLLQMCMSLNKELKELIVWLKKRGKELKELNVWFKKRGKEMKELNVWFKKRGKEMNWKREESLFSTCHLTTLAIFYKNSTRQISETYILNIYTRPSARADHL